MIGEEGRGEERSEKKVSVSRKKERSSDQKQTGDQFCFFSFYFCFYNF